jgi:hypothetical protein
MERLDPAVEVLDAYPHDLWAHGIREEANAERRERKRRLPCCDFRDRARHFACPGIVEVAEEPQGEVARVVFHEAQAPTRSFEGSLKVLDGGRLRPTHAFAAVPRGFEKLARL